MTITDSTGNGESTTHEWRPLATSDLADVAEAAAEVIEAVTLSATADTWHQCDDCVKSYPTVSGLHMHRNRVHVAEDVRQAREAKRVVSLRASKAARRAARLQAELPDDVRAIMDEHLTIKRAAYERNRRMAASRKRGETAAQFDLLEVARAHTLVAGRSWSGAMGSLRKSIFDGTWVPPTKSAAPRQSDATPVPRSSALVPLPQAVMVEDDHAERVAAGELFGKVANATRAIFPNADDLYDRIIEVAAWQVDTMRMLQR